MSTRLLALFTAAVLGLSACSDSSDDADQAESPTTTSSTPTTDPTTGGGPSGADTALGDVIDRLRTESARFEGTLWLVGSPGAQLNEPIEVPVSGSLDSDHGASQISMDMGAVIEGAFGDGEELPPGFEAMFDQPLEVITIGEQAWMRMGLLGMITGVDTEWIGLTGEESGQLTSRLGLGSSVTSPTALLEQLDAADATLEELGTDTVRGQETTHYRTEVDGRELADPSEAEQGDAGSGPGAVDGPLPVEVWIGEDGRLYRYAVEIGATNETEGGQAEGGDAAPSGRLEFEFFDYGAEIDIEAPPESEVTPLSELDGLLGSGLDSADGTGTGTGTGTGRASGGD